jgi:hypothetical protein
MLAYGYIMNASHSHEPHMSINGVLALVLKQISGINDGRAYM